MHEKIKKLSGLVDKLIEQNFKLKTESKSLRNSIMELRNKIERLEQDNQRLIINSSAKKNNCLLYTSPSPRDRTRSRMPSSA